MAVQIHADGDLFDGGAVIEASDGTKLAVISALEAGYGGVSLYSDIDGTPTLEDSERAETIFGAGTLGFVHAAIDSSNNVHIVVAANPNIGTRDVAYCIATESGGSWTFGAWEAVVASYTSAGPDNPGCAISLDSNDKPHVLFVDYVSWMGTGNDNVYYTEKTGASWSGPDQIGLRDTKTDSYDSPKITLRNSDYIEVVYNFVTDIDLAYQTYTGSWSGESVYDEGTEVVPGGVIATTGGTPYRSYVADADEDIEENNVDTGYDTHGTYRRVSPVLVDDSVRYIFYIDTSDDVHLISNDGGGWVDEGALQAGTYEYVIAEWAYNNENQSGEINYIFEESGTIYYDSFDLGGAVARVPRHGFTNFQIPGIV